MNITTKLDLQEILGKIDHRLGELEKAQMIIENDIDNLVEDIDRIEEENKETKESQRAQIWTLIGVLITAVGGFLVAVGRSVL
ncbi:MAG: hypothetical protein AAGA80_23060 [Cyanobacteria bacterium P01_F01_bin.143]